MAKEDSGSPLPDFFVSFQEWLAINNQNRPEVQLRFLLRNLIRDSVDSIPRLAPGNNALHIGMRDAAEAALKSNDVFTTLARGMALMVEKNPRFIDVCPAFKSCISVSRVYDVKQLLPTLPKAKETSRAFDRLVTLLRALHQLHRSYTTIGKWKDVHESGGKLHCVRDIRPRSQILRRRFDRRAIWLG